MNRTKKNAGRSGSIPVAGNAKPGRRVNRKQAKRLAIRLADYSRMMEDSKGESKVRMRKENGGYHRPGSNNH